MITVYDVGKQKSDTPSETTTPETVLYSFRCDPALMADFERASKEQMRITPTRTQALENAMKFFIESHAKPPKAKPKPKPPR